MGSAPCPTPSRSQRGRGSGRGRGQAAGPAQPVRKRKPAPVKYVHFNYNDVSSFDFEPVLFHDLKQYGFAPMHKKVKCIENICLMAEEKHAILNYPDIYFDPEQGKKPALDKSRAVFKHNFKEQLGIKYFIPDPKNGGNSNNGPMMTRIVDSPLISAKILDISVQSLLYLRKCLTMINSTSFVNPDLYDKLAKAAFVNIISDLGAFGHFTATTHSLLVHGSSYIRWAQNELGVSIGSLSENALEMGNKLNLQYRKLFSRKNAIKKETYDIFKRRLMISDPYLLLQGVKKQKIRKGNIYKKGR